MNNIYKDYSDFCYKVNNKQYSIEQSKEKIEKLLNRKVLDHQVAPIECGIRFKKGAFFLSMGAGKTFIILSILHILNTKYDVKALCLCPKIVIKEWILENEKFKFNLQINKNLTVTTYQQVHKLEPSNFNVIILDESQKIKNPRSQISKTVFNFSKNIKNRFILTGTPDHNSVLDVYNQLIFINPFAFEYSLPQIIEKFFFTIKKQRYKIHKITNKGIAYFSQKIRENSIVYNKKDKNIEVETNYIYCDINEEQKELIKNVSKEYYTLNINDNIQMIKKALVKEIQISSGYIKNNNEIHYLNSSNKINAVINTAKDMVEKYGQVIIWCSLIETGNILKRKLQNTYKVDFVNGKINKKQTDKIINEFKKKNLDILLIQILTGNFGVNLQQCNVMLFAELDWNANNLAQAIARCARKGQDKKVYVYFFITKKTIEEYMLHIVKNKRKISKKVLFSKYMHKDRI